MGFHQVGTAATEGCFTPETCRLLHDGAPRGTSASASDHIRLDIRPEVGGRLVLGPPKTRAGVRAVHLPPFLVELLTEHRAQQDHEHVFTTTDGGGLLRRSNFRRRVWLPAVGGDSRRGWAPLMPGLHFHDLRHTHKTWLIEDGVPEIAQCKRLGHRLPGVRGTYSHVTQVMVDQLLHTLPSRSAPRSFAPNLLPRQQNSPSVKITDRLSDLRISLVDDTGIEPVTPTVSR